MMQENAGRLRVVAIANMVAGIVICLVVPYLTLNHSIDAEPEVAAMIYAAAYTVVVTILISFWLQVVRIFKGRKEYGEELKKKASGYIILSLLVNVGVIDLGVMYCLLYLMYETFSYELQVWLKPAWMWGFAAIGMIAAVFSALRGFALASEFERARR